MIVLLIFSIILHFFTFYWLVILIQRIKKVEDSQPESLKEEIEESLTAYLLDMKDENEQLLKHLKPLLETKVEAENNVQKRENRVAVQEPMPSSVIENKDDKGMNNAKEGREEDEALLFEPPKMIEEETFEPSLTGQAISLYQQGYNVTEIAKKLNRGKGEIELLIKFNLNQS